MLLLYERISLSLRITVKVFSSEMDSVQKSIRIATTLFKVSVWCVEEKY